MVILVAVQSLDHAWNIAHRMGPSNPYTVLQRNGEPFNFYYTIRMCYSIVLYTDAHHAVSC